MPTLSLLSQQTRVSQTEVSNAPKRRFNIEGVIAPGNASDPLVLPQPTDEQLGRAVNANGAVRLPGTPFYNVAVRRPYATPDADPCVIIVDDDGTGADVSVYQTPLNGGQIEILDVPADAVVRVVSATGNDSPLDAVTYALPTLLQY